MCGLIASSVAGAHHSFTAFDQTKTVTLTGTVKDWQWTNPHTWLYILVTDASGKTQERGIEGGSPQVVRGEQHLSRTIIKPGDRVQVTIHPRRDGSAGGSFYLDQPHPEGLKPSYFGHSVAHWDGSTLTVDSIGFSDKTEIFDGIGHSEKLHVTERLRINASGQLEDQEAEKQP